MFMVRNALVRLVTRRHDIITGLQGWAAIGRRDSLVLP